MLELLLQKGKFNKKFKQIFDNLDETILIINNNNQSIEYMNKFFFIQFKEIIESLESQVDSEDLERYNKFIELPLFVVYQAKDSNLLSIKDITQFENSELKNMVFSYGPLFDKPDKYYSIKINHINEDDNDELMMTISDTSQ